MPKRSGTDSASTWTGQKCCTRLLHFVGLDLIRVRDTPTRHGVLYFTDTSVPLTYEVDTKTTFITSPYIIH